MAYETIWEEDGVHWIFDDEFTNDDLLMSSQALYRDPRFEKRRYQILNFINVKIFPIEAKIIRVIAETDAINYKININMKVAVIADKIVMKGLTNMYKVYFELSCDDVSWETEVFKNEEDARKWINA